MPDTDVQLVSNDAVESERETAYLLKSEAMRKRLLEAQSRSVAIPMETVLGKLGL